MKRNAYLLLLLFSLPTVAQEPWTMERCMQYAVEHNHEVRLQHITLDDYKAERVRQRGAFLPGVEASVGGQYNFGRAIDPETNTYTHVNTFYSSYGISASVPVFDGFQRYNNLRAANANLRKGQSRLAAQKDATAQKVMETYLQLVYNKGCIALAKQKRAESQRLVEQTKVMVEVGQKGEADVVQMQATYAADDYEVTRQQGLYDKRLLALKEQMNYPIDEALEIAPYDEAAPALVVDDAGLYAQASTQNPTIQQAEAALQSAKYAYRSSKSALYPTIYVGAGLSTTYYKQLNMPGASSFHDQFRNNVGKYVSATLSVPLFNRMQTLSNIRRQRNQMQRAAEELSYRHSELQRLIQEALTEQANSHKEMEKMRLKVEADSLAARLTIRKYEEGMATSIDVQTQTVALLQSQVLLLQCQLAYVYQTSILNYYKGIPLWTE